MMIIINKDLISPQSIIDMLAYRATLKIRKKSKCDRNQLKLSTQHKYMYMYQEKI